jgi:hypothetical protein
MDDSGYYTDTENFSYVTPPVVISKKTKTLKQKFYSFLTKSLRFIQPYPLETYFF